MQQSCHLNSNSTHCWWDRKPFQSCFPQFGIMEFYQICSISIGSVFLLLSLLSWQNTCIKIWNIWLTGQRKRKKLTKGPSMPLPTNFTNQIYRSDLLVHTFYGYNFLPIKITSSFIVKNCISTFYVEEFYLFKKRNFCWVKDTNHKKVRENLMVKICQQTWTGLTVYTIWWSLNL